MNEGHLANWIDAMHARDPGRLTADIDEGHFSSSSCLLGKIAYETERTLRFDAAPEQFIDDEDANRWLTRVFDTSSTGARHPELAREN